MGGREIVTLRRAFGIGCSSHATDTELLALIATVASESGPPTILASLDRRAAIAAARARTLGIGVATFSAEALAAIGGTTVTSERATDAVGTPSVAEAAALAAAGSGARLIVERRSSARCTCAVAEAP